MELKVDSLKCTGCRICEFACNYHQDESISPIGSSMMFYFEEKKNYYGMMVKRGKPYILEDRKASSCSNRANRSKVQAPAPNPFSFVLPVITVKKKTMDPTAYRLVLMAF